MMSGRHGDLAHSIKGSIFKSMAVASSELILGLTCFAAIFSVSARTSVRTLSTVSSSLGMPSTTASTILPSPQVAGTGSEGSCGTPAAE